MSCLFEEMREVQVLDHGEGKTYDFFGVLLIYLKACANLFLSPFGSQFTLWVCVVFCEEVVAEVTAG